ncbi:MAG: hypothetical protein FK734_18345 [Asgard group archaeon]|nr:hypothetical protein [Asgard group archaeon]
MSEKIICKEFDEKQTIKIELGDFIAKNIAYIDQFLILIANEDESILEKLLVKYKEELVAKNISHEENELIRKLAIEYPKFKILQNYPEYISLIENTILHFLNFQKYKEKYQQGEKFELFLRDQIRGNFHFLYYLAYSLLKLLPREKVLELTKEMIDQIYESFSGEFTKYENLEEMSKGYHGKGCWKTHNLVAQIKDNRYYLKITRCIWAEVYAELPDLELASLLECYGDFSKMPYINPNLALSRTKTMVEGYEYCDFVHYDKRIEQKIVHPNEDFWKEF